MTSSSSAPSRRGFALKELFVILFLITVVYVIFVPVVTQCRQHEKKGELMHCLSNSKQIGLAMMMYAADYDETFPPCVQYSGGTIIHWSSMDKALPPTPSNSSFLQSTGLLRPYVPNSDIFTCPLLSDRGTSLPTYMMNDLAGGIKIGYFTRPEKTVLIMDGEPALLNFGHAYLPQEPQHFARVTHQSSKYQPIGGSVREAATLHRGGAVYTFADGHAKWFKPEQVYFPPLTNNSRSHRNDDPRLVGPNPAGDMMLNGRQYNATFHIK
jgi:prepilin-type processing-associated H-X9-DG protein